MICGYFWSMICRMIILPTHIWGKNFKYCKLYKGAFIILFTDNCIPFLIYYKGKFTISDSEDCGSISLLWHRNQYSFTPLVGYQLFQRLSTNHNKMATVLEYYPECIRFWIREFILFYFMHFHLMNLITCSMICLFTFLFSLLLLSAVR